MQHLSTSVCINCICLAVCTHKPPYRLAPDCLILYNAIHQMMDNNSKLGRKFIVFLNGLNKSIVINNTPLFKERTYVL